jgi:predicted Zn-dependent protease
MSQTPGGTGDSRYQENPAGAGPAGRDQPGQDVHGWYTRGMELLGKGSPAAAAQLLQRAVNAVPDARSIREALARAQFDTGRYREAAENFRLIVEASPSDDYAHFGLGLALSRAGSHRAAAQHLALAAAMRPDRKHYADALRQVRATLRARADAERGGRHAPGEDGAPGGAAGPQAAGPGPDGAPPG